jgi:hypothetical protein
MKTWLKKIAGLFPLAAFAFFARDRLFGCYPTLA